MANKILPVLHIDQFEVHKKETFFYANNLIDHLKNHHFIHTPHKHDFFLVVMFTKGNGIHEVDFVSYKVKPGSVFLLMPGQMHNWKLSNNIDGFVFFHTKEFFDLTYNGKKISDYLFFSSVHHSPVVYLKSKLADIFTLKFKEILQEYELDEPLKYEKIGALVDLMYIELSRNYKIPVENDSQKHNYLDKMQKLEKLIDENFVQSKSPAWFANKMNMSEKHLNRICKTCFGKTTTDMIANRVVLEAKRLLMQTNVSVSDVAIELGYEDLAYFSRLFKKRTSETPSEFVKKHY